MEGNEEEKTPETASTKSMDNDTDSTKPKATKEKTNSKAWLFSTLALGVVVLVLLFTGFNVTNMTGSVIAGGDISQDEAGDVVVDFANSQTGGGVELVEIVEEYGLYKVIVSYQGSDLPLYITKDGNALVQGVLPLEDADSQDQAQDSQSNTQAPEAPKSDKPKAELFIMTHCPYGTQAEKGFIPAIKALGDSIDAEVRFVHYFMHAPEETETPVQVCIREEQSDKFLDYLECFLEDGNKSRCIAEVDVDEDSLNTCLEEKADEYYAADSEASEGYGVRGSPTLVLNGVAVSTARSPDAMLQTICSAFTTAPEACNTELDSASPSPGFGYSGTGSDTQAQC